MPSRPIRRSRSAVVLATLVGVLAASPAVGPPTVARAAPGHECDAPFDAGSRKVHRFRLGGERLDFARIEVRAQRRNRNAHCILVRTDRRVSIRWTGRFFAMRDGRCAPNGKTEHSPFRTSGIRTGFRTSSESCAISWTYEIQRDGRWFAATVKRVHR